jgi:hypothetical protein
MYSHPMPYGHPSLIQTPNGQDVLIVGMTYPFLTWQP